MTDAVTLRDRLFGSDPRFRRFLLKIAAATAFPMIAVPLSGGANPGVTETLTLAGLLAFFGGPAHVASTTWFYTDPVARGHFTAHPLRYFVVPVVLIVATTAVYVVWPGQPPAHWVNFGFTCWLLWHYQKQNWGVHSFVTRVISAGPASRLEGWILKTAVLGGIAGGIQSAGFGMGTAVAAWSHTAFRAGLALTMALPVMIAVALVTIPELRRAPLRIASLLGTAGFFLPVFVFGNPNNAILPYGFAHGLQYLVYMGYVASSAAVAGTADSGSRRPGLLVMLACVVAVGAVLRVGGDMAFVERWHLLPAFGFVLGVTMAHFVVDAGIWRLRDEFPRRYVGAAFPFLSSGSR